MLLDKQEFDALHSFLDSEAARINNTDFIVNDPVQFPRRFHALPDIEIAALLSATIAWGNRKMICNNCAKMLTIMGNDPLHYVLSGDYELLPDEMNIHRTFFVRDFKYMLRGLKNIYGKHSSLNDFAVHHHVGHAQEPAWTLVEMMQHEMQEANGGDANMFLRWMVRQNSPVDLGLWKWYPAAELLIPLDVHVGDTARSLRLISRRANDKKTVLELTSLLRLMRPSDPVIYDYALFGIGIGDKYLAPAR